ncbi:MAG: crossover junction endodeoxyribonuclease RuvC [Methanosarcinales archaeon]|nr:MAG: crossover junction endodeoxyribonuclease RuvC [Methanosarcinales archaeon]
MIIIGIDPGLAKTGFGVIDGVRCIKYGMIVTSPDVPVQMRLRTIFREICAVLDAHKPRELAIEQLFFSRNVSSAIDVSHARGVVLLAASERDLDVFEYTPNKVKQAVTGSGRADKKQVQKMVRAMFGINEAMPVDAADAVAVALCHANMRLPQN